MNLHIILFQKQLKILKDHSFKKGKKYISRDQNITIEKNVVNNS